LGSSDPLQTTVGGFLDDVAAETPAPGAGAAATVAVALAAALVEMTARFSTGSDAALAAAQALRARVAPLAEADAEAYADFLATRRARVDDTAARSCATAIPLEIAECGAETAALAASLAEHGNPNLRGEAVAAAYAASAGASIAATLVEINLEGGPDERLDRARAFAASAAEHAARARSNA
jgi:formiminotetrahydrofolate cyclodeaminase